MSFLIGPVSGALVAGGVYYGFSNLIHTRTSQHRNDLHVLSVRLVEAPSLIIAPPSAATRIAHHPFGSLVRSRWNQELQFLFAGFREWESRTREWGQRVMYGADVHPTRKDQS